MLILLVEDELGSRDSITRLLHTEGFEVIAFENAVDASNYLDTHPLPDALLIDFKLGNGPNGTSLARRIRARSAEVAIIMMSAYASREEIVTAYRSGIDDFLLRPFETAELLTSLSDGMLRHLTARRKGTEPRTVGPLEVDITTARVTWYGVELAFTRTEFSIICQLTARPGAVLSYSELLATAKGERVAPDEARRRLKTHMNNMRQKFQRAHPSIGWPIKTRRAMGFVWEVGGENSGDEDNEEVARA